MDSYRIFFIAIAALALFANTAFAYWIWTPQTKKFINPKNAVKDSPKEQFDWATSFYDAKDYTRAAAEFEKLVKNYEYSEYASDAQYYVGLSYENMGKLYTAFQNYQKTVDNFPHIENLDEIIAREFNIANFYATKDSPKILGMEIMMALDRAIEIYKKVVDNAPYGKLADEAQFKMGEAFKKAERYDEAMQTFQKVVDDYPNSKFVDKAKYEVAYCAYKASLKPAYDIEPTDKAIKAFQDFAETNQDKTLSKEADKTVHRLKDMAAEKSLMTARFYESQKHYESAIIYYKEIVDRFSGSSFVDEARSKIEKLSAIIENRESRKASAAKGNESAGKGWNPLSFMSKSKPKEVPPQAVASDDDGKKDKPQEIKSQKKGWMPFRLAGSAKKEQAAKKEAAPQTVKSKGWNPLSFMSKSKPKEKSVQTVKTQKKSWSPFRLAGSAKKERVAEENQPQKTAKFKAWNPFSFANKSKSKEVPAQAVKSQKKGWAPFSFAGSAKKERSVGKKEGAKIVGLKGWNPLSFASKPKPKDMPVRAVTGAEPSKSIKFKWRPISFASTQKPKDMTVQPEATAPKAETETLTTAPQTATVVQETETARTAEAEAKMAEPLMEPAVVKDTATANTETNIEEPAASTGSPAN